MQERTVLVVVVVLVVSTAAAGVAVNALRPDTADTWRAFNVSLAASGSPAVGAPLNLSVVVRQGSIDPKSLWVVFLSLDVGTMNISSATPGTNPWGYATVWNLTGMDLSSPRTFNATVLPTEPGNEPGYAMIWVPLGDIASVPIDPSGHVNPAGVTLESVVSASLLVTAAA